MASKVDNERIVKASPVWARMTPGLGEGIAGYEIINGKDIFTGEKLTIGDKVVDVVSLATWGISRVVGKGGAVKAAEIGDGTAKATEVTKYSSLDEGLNFSNKALEHMDESSRQVPVQTLQDAIRHGEALPDPRGSSATMYYTTMTKDGKLYNLEVLYDKATNSVYHFEYARKAMGKLPAIKK